ERPAVASDSVGFCAFESITGATGMLLSSNCPEKADAGGAEPFLMTGEGSDRPSTGI
ncbi:hypothetical protein BHE74_00056597, partial [Ensete ventricosum]